MRKNSNIISQIINGFAYSLNGLKAAYKSELSFRLEILGGIFLIIISGIYGPLSRTEIIMLLISYAFLLSLELINTSIEKMFERLHPEHHELVGISKDTASAAVLVSLILMIVVAVVIFWDKISI